jgi:bifunctional non-homologous end joining protein LigD
MAKTVDEALTRYRAKRRFGETREPAGGAANAVPGALYLIQKHAATRLHYDFRLELDGVLLSWAVTRGPSYHTKDKRLAVRTEDHPLEYGGFEGTIPKGNYGGGTVMLWDTGSWTPVGDPHEGLERGKLAFILHGERLRGHWALVRMKPRPGEKNENWLLIKENDELANTHDDLLEREVTSVVSGRRMEDIARGESVWQAASPDLPAFIEPMLATLVDEPPDDHRNWLYEIKFDGYRALIAASGSAVRIHTRSGLDWTDKFPGIAQAIAALNLPPVLLDGEIAVVGPDGRTDFAALVAALEGKRAALSCFLFDILHLDGKDLSREPLARRQAALQTLIPTPGRNAPIQLSEVFSGDAKTLLKTACAHGLEGIIAKRADRPYRSGRHGDWLKIKCGHAQEFIIIGFSPSQARRPFASLLMAVRADGALRYAGRVGSGFSDATLAKLAALRDKFATSQPPCDVPSALRRGVTWVKPELVANIEFAGWTGDAQIRHGRFIGLRADKPAKTVRREMPEPAVTITHPERVVYQDAHVTKGDIAAYMQAAAPLIMPYLEDRFISFVRCPDGADGKCFFQRHPSPGFGDWLPQAFVNTHGKTETYMYCRKPDALLHAVQMGVLEFHLWGSRHDKVDLPDRIVFDLDPDPTVDFAAVKDAAARLRAVLDALGLDSLPLLSGGKGIHVVVPIQRQHEWPVIKSFAADLAGRVAADAPDKFVATMSKAKRTGKIFIDHFRNERGATAIAPYSPRARPGAAVAFPVSWAALKNIGAAEAYDVARARAAIEAGENGWAGYEKIRQKLTKAAIKAIQG